MSAAAAKPFGGVFGGARVLITGHTGFKGSWLTSWMLGLGATVAGYSSDVPTEPSLYALSELGCRIEDHRADIRDAARLRDVVERFKPDFVFHLAAQAIVSTSYADPVETVSCNVVGTASVLDALRRWVRGTCNVVSGGSASRLDYVREIVRLSGLPCRVEPSEGGFARRAKVSHNEAATNGRLRLLGLDTMGPWPDGLARYIERLRPTEAWRRLMEARP